MDTLRSYATSPLNSFEKYLFCLFVCFSGGVTIVINYYYYHYYYYHYFTLLLLLLFLFTITITTTITIIITIIITITITIKTEKLKASNLKVILGWDAVGTAQQPQGRLSP